MGQLCEREGEEMSLSRALLARREGQDLRTD